jgi:ribosome biogenesis ATPase
LFSNTPVTSNECDVTLAISPDGEVAQDVHTPDAIDVKTSATTDSQMSMANEKQKVQLTKTGEEKHAKLSAGLIPKDHAPLNTRLVDLVGVDICVEKMLEPIAILLCHPEVYLHTGVQPPRSVLLHHPPGCTSGKLKCFNGFVS